MTSCTACGAQPAYRPAYAGAAYCRKHFLSLIEKRVRKDLRLSKAIDLSRPYRLDDDGSSRIRLLQQLLDGIFGGRLRLEDDAPDRIEPHCLEEDVSERFSLFLEKKPLRIAGVRPLRSVAAADIAFLLGEDFSPLSHLLLRAVEKKQPGSYFAMSHILKEEE